MLKLVGPYAAAFVIIDLQAQIHMPRFLSSQDLVPGAPQPHLVVHSYPRKEALAIKLDEFNYLTSSHKIVTILYNSYTNPAINVERNRKK